MDIAREVLARAALDTAPRKRESPDYAPGQAWSHERFGNICEERGYDPALVAVEFMRRERESLAMTDKEYMDVTLKLMEYLYAKRRAVEVSGPDGGPVQTEDVTRPTLTKEEWLAAHGLAASTGTAG